jgi:hypothetical protein
VHEGEGGAGDDEDGDGVEDWRQEGFESKLQYSTTKLFQRFVSKPPRHTIVTLIVISQSITAESLKVAINKAYKCRPIIFDCRRHTPSSVGGYLRCL